MTAISLPTLLATSREIGRLTQDARDLAGPAESLLETIRTRLGCPAVALFDARGPGLSRLAGETAAPLSAVETSATTGRRMAAEDDTWLAIPVRALGAVPYVLAVSRDEPFGEESAAFELVASRMGLSLERTLLLFDQKESLERAERDASRLALLNRIAGIAVSGKALRPMLQDVVEALRESFSWEFVACVLVDEAAGRFVCEAVTSDIETSVVPGYGRELGSGIVGTVAKTGEPWLLNDVREAANYVETMPGALSELCVPVVHEGHVVAILNLESRRLAAFHDQLPLLTTVAEQVAGGIHLAKTNRDLEELNRRLLEAEAEISRLLASSPHASEDLPSWSSSVAREIARVVRAKEIDIWLLEDGVPVRLTSGRTAAPTVQVLRRGSDPRRTGEEELVVPIEGPSGDSFGALVVSGAPASLAGSGERLLTAFAKQLGGTLELRRAQQQLAVAEARRQEAREALHHRGIETLNVCPSCGDCYPHTLEMCPTDGRLLDGSWLIPLVLEQRYRLLRRIGQGGMGTVFSARDEKLDRDVALKFVRPELLGSTEMATRFDREARAVARIQHPCVVALHDSGRLEDGSLYLAMELLPGRTLSSLIDNQGPGTPKQVAAFLRRAGAGLDAAHAAGVVHRDVKPQNFFVKLEGDTVSGVKLFDFGLARSSRVDRGLTRMGMVVGTPAFMSPEQARGEDVTPATDLYSLAVVAFEALTGEPVVKSREITWTLAEILSELPPRLSTLLPVSPEVDRAFAAALAKDAASRPAGVSVWVDSFVADLEALPATAIGWR